MHALVELLLKLLQLGFSATCLSAMHLCEGHRPTKVPVESNSRKTSPAVSAASPHSLQSID
jgi:hypothetical protein